MSEIELAWAAGFFEGEGCLTNALDRGHKRWHISLPQSGDRVLLDRFHQAVGGIGNITGPYKFESQILAKKTRHTYQAYGPKARAVLELLEPYMAGPKLQKLNEWRKEDQ